MSIAECDENIVVAMAVHQRRSMGRDLNLEDAHGFIFQDKVVRWFRSDWDCNWSVQPGTESAGRKEVRASWHSSDSSRVHNLPPDDRRDYFSRQMPSVERRVLRFRVRLGGIEGPLLFRIEKRNVGDRAADERPSAAKIET